MTHDAARAFAPRQPLFIASRPVHVPLEPRAQRALTEWLARHAAELDAVLEPYGLRANDVAVPEFVRLAFVDEVRPR